MKRRSFLQAASAVASGCVWDRLQAVARENARGHELRADVVIVGGGLGGCAAALACLRHGLSVILTEETDWIGGQLTSQGVPPDEHRWIESHGATRTYRDLRQGIRRYYRQHYPLTDAARARKFLNPGNGAVSRLCHEPRVALAVLANWMAPFISGGRLTLLTSYRATAADVTGDRVEFVQVKSLKSGRSRALQASYFVDATELGDLLPLTKTEFVCGAESREETHELHAGARQRPENQQAFTVCFAVDYCHGEDHRIDEPREYEFWRDFVPKLTPAWPGKLLDFTYTHPRSGMPRRLGFNPSGGKHGGVLNLWNYRRIVQAAQFQRGAYAGDISLINWPQNDYFLGNLIGVTEQEREQHIQRAKQLSLSLLYWLQTDAPRPDGGAGFRGLRLRPDVMGTEDGLAKYPYVRESRRIRALFTVLEEHVGQANRAQATGRRPEETQAAAFFDSVGVGSYAIDLHPTSGGDNYIDFAAFPFQIPLGSLIPQRMENLLPASKNVGTTHITSGCYRLHPVEWGIGEAVGYLLKYVFARRTTPRAVRASSEMLNGFQDQIRKEGVETAWPMR